MKSVLQADKDLAKEFGIKPESDLDPRFQLSYLRAQIDEFKKAMYRNRVDALISMDLAERAKTDKDEALENKARENLANYRNFIKQTTGALTLLEQYISELEPTVPISE